MSDLHVFGNGTDWWIAESLDDAYSLVAEYYYGGDLSEIDREDHELDQLPDSEMIGIICEDGRPSDCGETIELTAAEWCKRERRGLLCSTEY